GSRLEEVVDALGEELADLVDEQTEADSADSRGAHLRPRTGPDEHEHDRYAHQQAAPQHMCDVQPAAADFRIAGHDQERTDEDDGENGGEQEDFKAAECPRITRMLLPHVPKYYRPLCSPGAPSGARVVQIWPVRG